MKTTPLILFFILLVVLVMSIIFSRYLPLKNTQEGLIGFNNNGGDNSINIPQYSGAGGKNVKHIYDSIYFDVTNGNLIEVNGIQLAGAGATPNTTINGISGVTRNQKSFSYNSSATNETDESKISKVESKFNYFMYETPNTNWGSNDRYKVVYISSGTDTILHILKIDRTKHVILKTVFINSGTMETKIWSDSNLKGTYGFLTIGSGNAAVKAIDLPKSDSINVNTSQENILYVFTSGGNTSELYQIMKSCIYDPEIGNIYLLKSINGSSYSIDKMYARDGTDLPATYTRPSTTTFNTGSYAPWAVVDTDNNLIIVYPYSNKTVITVLREIGTEGNLTFGPVVRFSGEHLDNGVAIGSSTSSSSGAPHSSSTSSSSSSSSNRISGTTGSCGPTDYQCIFDDLMKKWFPNGSNNADMMYQLWLPYFNSLVSAGTSNDFMLKSQIVPPVCPSCPSCNSSDGVCSSCGGNGGSGTHTDKDNYKPKGYTGSTGTYNYNSNHEYDNNNNKKSYEHNDNKQYDNDSRFNGSGVGGTISNVTGDVTGLVGSTVGTAGSIVNNAVNTAGGLLYSAGSGAVNLLKSGVGGQSQYGPVGINYQTQQPGVQQRDQYYTQGQTNTPVDYYSQYGALQSRAGNYMPMTADFSRFGK